MVTWSDPGYEAVIREIHGRAGLVFSPARRLSVENMIDRAMLRSGARDIELFAHWIKLDGALRDALIGDLTVGESYFFRDPSQFELIEHEIVPELLTRREPDRSLRVWSAGCASGEEPYSLAILFERLGLAGRVRIVGSEISMPRLEAARRGRYNRWALRGVPANVIATYFERDGRYFDLIPRLRGAVDFRRHNLAADAYPDPESGLAEMDLILCRNVLIYFDPETVQTVATKLLASLAKDGWLILSAADPPLASLVPCTAVITPHGLAYRPYERSEREEEAPPRWGGSDLRAHVDRVMSPYGSRGSAPLPILARPSVLDPPDTASESVGLVEADTLPEPDAHPDPSDPSAPEGPGGVPDLAALHAALVRGEYSEAAEGAALAIEREDDAEAYWIIRVRALANQGRLEEAGRVCAAGLDQNQLSEELMYLHAVLLAEAGRDREAVVAAQRVLYLDRGLVMAHILRAQALSRLGERVSALHALGNAKRLLVRQPADESVPASDGLTAGQLLERVRSHARLLQEDH